jgi:hypothetical protein
LRSADGVVLGASDEPDAGLAQLREDGEVEETQIEEQKGSRRERGKNSLPEALVMRFGVFFKEYLSRQTRSNVQESCPPSRQRRLGSVAQQTDLLDQRV